MLLLTHSLWLTEGFLLLLAPSPFLWCLWPLISLTAFFFIWVAMDATMKSVCGLLQDLDVIAKGSETVVMLPLETLGKGHQHCAYLDGISQTVLMAVSKGDWICELAERLYSMQYFLWLKNSFFSFLYESTLFNPVLPYFGHCRGPLHWSNAIEEAGRRYSVSSSFPSNPLWPSMWHIEGWKCLSSHSLLPKLFFQGVFMTFLFLPPLSQLGPTV